jgi:hypothetical protein
MGAVGASVLNSNDNPPATSAPPALALLALRGSLNSAHALPGMTSSVTRGPATAPTAASREEIGYPDRQDAHNPSKCAATSSPAAMTLSADAEKSTVLQHVGDKINSDREDGSAAVIANV